VLHRIFESSADRFPERPAVCFGRQRLTYAELDARANRLSHHLRAVGVRRGALVGLLLERSAEVYVAILAVLKAGAAYVPLDPDYPAERVAGILADCRAAAVVTAAGLCDRLGGFPGKTCLLDVERGAIERMPAARPDPAEGGAGPHDLAYVIYTSGSTGKPKGVMIEHRAVCHLVRAEADLYGVAPDDRVFQGFSVAFDASVEEVWAAFAAGAELVGGTREMMRAGGDLGRTLTDLGVTVFSTVPTLLAMLDGGLPTVRVLILGGEACPVELVDRWAGPGRTLFNTYGPTEATVVATAAVCTPGKPVTIGRPLPGYTVHLLDEARRPVPPGAVGELYIGGLGLARGYVGRDDLTAERFVPNPFRRPDDPDPRLYRTGDLARWTPDGELEFRGRCDAQVKIRGYRVELGEVEAELLGVPGVRAAAAAVAANGDGLGKLVGYVVPAAGAVLTADAVRARLRGRLPAYMVPAVVEELNALPTLPSGKVDRAKLPPPRARGATRAAPAVPPRTPLEARLAAVWAGVFGVPAVSVTDDFFLDLGGHSLLAARMTSELRASPDLRHAAVGDVYRHPTVERLAAHLSAAGPPAVAPAAAPAHAGIPRRRHFLCGLAQLVALYPLLGLVSVQWLAPYLVYSGLVADGWEVGAALAAALISLSAVYPALLLVGVAAKWLLVGRVKPGRYPLWGWFYLRWWAARAVLSVVPTGYLVGTPLLGWYARRLGARVGRNVYLGTDELFPFDTLAVDDNASVGADVGLRGYTVGGGFLHVGPVTVGCGGVVGNRAVVQPGSAVGGGAKLDELSLLRAGERVPPGELWAGSPARPVGHHPAAAAGLPGPVRRATLAAAYAVGSFLLPLFAIAAFLPGVIALNRLSRETDGYEYLLAAPLVAVSFVVLFALEVAAAKWLLLGRVKPGRYSRHGLFHLRKWFVDRLAELSLDVTGTLYATIYLNPWYRLLGVKVGRTAEISTACSVTHDLLTLGDESFVADAVTVGGARVEGDAVTLAPVRVGARAFAGNGAHLPPGRVLGDDGLIGCLSLLPAGAERPDTSWVGSPAFFLPRRQASADFPEESISRPPLRLWVARGAIELVRVTLPAAALVVITSLLITAAIRLRDELSLAEVVLLFPLLYAAAGVAAALFVAALKWLVIGRWRPTERPLWNHFVWRTELISGVREHLADPFLVGHLRGTPFIAWYFRLLGAAIGRRTYIDTTDLCEFDLTAVGDEAELNDECTLQTHLFEDRVMKVSHVSIGPRATVGAWTLVLYDTSVGAGVRLDDLSLLMKGEVLPAGTHWAGIPAARADAG